MDLHISNALGTGWDRIGHVDGFKVSNSLSELAEDPFPTGYNPLCPTCGYLNWLYGPTDGELTFHISNNHSTDEYRTDEVNYNYASRSQLRA